MWYQEAAPPASLPACRGQARDSFVPGEQSGEELPDAGPTNTAVLCLTLSDRSQPFFRFTQHGFL